MQSDCQQHEPTEASWQNIANRSRNLLASARGGCQGISPNFDKILMDVAALLYFGQRAWRILKWKNQKNKEVE